MKNWTQPSWMLAISLLVAAAVIGGADRRSVDSLKVTGTVLDSSGKGIAKARVALIRGGVAVQEVEADEKGAYSVSIQSGSPVDVRYRLEPDYPPIVLVQISGDRSHTISKVLYKESDASKEGKLAISISKTYLTAMNVRESEK